MNTDMQQAVQGLFCWSSRSARYRKKPQPAADFRMPDLTPPGAGYWSGGAYFQGNNVIIPGGPSLIDGELFIPNS